MLFVANTAFDISAIINKYPENSMERHVLNTMSASTEKYEYDTIKQLDFELKLRREIVDSAVSLNRSGLAFSNFKDSICNEKYWTRTDNGGFLLNRGAKPSEAIHDIFANGNQYATECATAIVMIYYKALLSMYGDELFDRIFSKIYLMDWDVTEPLLEDVSISKPAADSLLGDRVYFNNPDFDPETPEWQGENAIVLPDSMYYGHGIGITTADAIIEELNSRRKEYADQSAYLLHSAGRPDFKKLSDHYQRASTPLTPLVWKPFPAPLTQT